MEKKNIILWAKRVGFLLIGIMMLLTLSFNLLSVDILGLGKYASDSGFSLLGFSSDIMTGNYEFGATIIGIFSIFILIIAISTIVVAIMQIAFALMGREDRLSGITNKLEKVLVILCIVFSFWYLIEGVVYSAIAKGEFDTFYSGNTWYTVKCTTYAYLPFIFMALLVGGYYSTSYFANKQVETCVVGKKKTNVKNDMQKLELLKQYKVMLDNNIITQEEFEEKKKEIL